MSKWERFLYPPGWLLILLSLISTVGLVGVFRAQANDTPLAYIIYVLSFYTLSVVCLYFYKRLPDLFQQYKQRVYSTHYGKKYMTDINYKVRVSLYISLGINLVYAGFKLVSGIIYGSFWFDAFAVYYLLLTVIRFLLLRYMRKSRSRQDLIAEFHRYRLCGILMLVMNLALSGVVMHMIVQNPSNAYDEVVVITMAVYAFYAVTVSIIDLLRYRRYESPVILAAKSIRFTAALVSLLSMEASMLAQRGSDETFRRLMIALTGAGVCLIVLGLSVYMILRANHAIKKLKESRK